MNIEIFVDNLENMIADKQNLISNVRNPTLRGMVEMNVLELHRILADARALRTNIRNMKCENCSTEISKT